MSGVPPFCEIEHAQSIFYLVPQGYRPQVPADFDPELRTLCQRSWYSYPVLRPNMQDAIEILQSVKVKALIILRL